MVVNKTDYMVELEKDFDYKDEHFDFIQQAVSCEYEEVYDEKLYLVRLQPFRCGSFVCNMVPVYFIQVSRRTKTVICSTNI